MPLQEKLRYAAKKNPLVFYIHYQYHVLRLSFNVTLWHHFHFFSFDILYVALFCDYMCYLDIIKFLNATGLFSEFLYKIITLYQLFNVYFSDQRTWPYGCSVGQNSYRGSPRLRTPENTFHTLHFSPVQLSWHHEPPGGL